MFQDELNHQSILSTEFFCVLRVVCPNRIGLQKVLALMLFLLWLWGLQNPSGCRICIEQDPSNYGIFHWKGKLKILLLNRVVKLVNDQPPVIVWTISCQASSRSVFCYQLNQGNKGLLYQEPREEPRDQAINGISASNRKMVIKLTDCPQAFRHP